jgi:FKBP-type peptidyl-prolyl cis-trans isomerase
MKQMKLKQTAFLVIGLLPLGVIAQPNQPPTMAPPSGMVMPSKPSPPPAEMPEKSKLSYAVGMYFGGNITNSIKRGELDLDISTVLAAITDVINGKPTHMTDKEMSAVLNQYKAARQAQRKAEDEAAKVKSEAFLAQFAKSPGVISLPNGLEYKVIKEGSGAMPTENDNVNVAYRGTLSDGTQFDRNDNFTTPLKGRIIQGWQQMLTLMKVGSKVQVAIPPSLGYGSRGMPPRIPGNSVLVFDLELKSIAPAAPVISSAPPLASRTALQQQQPTPVVSGQIIKVPSAEEMKKGAKIEVIDSSQTNTATNAAKPQ